MRPITIQHRASNDGTGVGHRWGWWVVGHGWGWVSDTDAEGTGEIGHDDERRLTKAFV